MANPLGNKQLTVKPTGAVTLIVNGCSSGSVQIATSGNVVSAAQQNLKVATSGVLVTTVLSPILSITGAGEVNFIGAFSVDATSRTHRIKLTIDGVVAFDATSSAVTTAENGLIAVGSFATYLREANAVKFSRSFLFEYASSVSETAKTSFVYAYKTTT